MSFMIRISLHVIIIMWAVTHNKFLFYCIYLLDRIPQYNCIFSKFQYLMHTAFDNDNTGILLCA